MLANNRIIKANGLMKIPNNSIGARMIFIGSRHTWHPKDVTPVTFVTRESGVIMNVMMAKQKVTARLLVTPIPKGVIPPKFRNQIKKNTVSKITHKSSVVLFANVRNCNVISNKNH